MRWAQGLRVDRNFPGWLLCVGVGLWLGACASTAPSDRRTDPSSPPSPVAAPTPTRDRHHEPKPRVPDPPLNRPEAIAPNESFESGLVEAALELLGSPYRYAGATPRGFDCSGFVSYVFAGKGIDLPRTTVGQSSLGTWIPLDEVGRGDLIFFADGEVPTHVGVVVSRPGQPLTMVHSSSSLGVVETVVEESDYWLDRLRFARRHH